MAIEYDPPNDLTVDVFTVPSTPESTPLSQAGSSNRDHPEMHADVGLALEKLEKWAAIKTHDHSGDATSPASGPQLEQANTHQNADTDASPQAIHHTLAGPLGGSPLQASPGNHTHYYGDLLQTPMTICTSVSRPTQPFLGQQIYETDTNRARVWGQFSNNVITQGLYSVDYFNQSNSSSLDSNWKQTYGLTPSAANGIMATPDGQSCSWTAGSSNVANWCIALRSNPADATTTTDDQVVTYQTAQNLVQWEAFAGYATNDVYLRVAPDLSSYVRFAVAVNFITVYYTVNGPANEQQLGQFGWPFESATQTNASGSTWLTNLSVSGSDMQTVIAGATLSFVAQGRSFQAQVNGQTVATFNDAAAVTAMGPANRGWGFGMHAPQAILFGQLTPANLKYVGISDYIRYASVNRWSLLSSAQTPCLIMSQQKTRQNFATTGTNLTFDTVTVDNFGMYSPNSPSQIRIQESGLYHIDASSQWDPAVVPNIAGIVVMLNGQRTGLQTQQWLQWNNMQPGFSQTVAVTGKMRLAVNDILTIQVFFVGGSQLLTDIYSFIDINNGVFSHCEIGYLSP